MTRKSYNGFPPALRSKAMRWLNGEYAAGRRTRPISCDACGQTLGTIQAHSEDYSEPFGDHIGHFGLCYVCHMMIHNRDNQPARWEAYRTRVRSGFMAADYAHSWMHVLAYLRGAELPWQPSPRALFEWDGSEEVSLIALLDTIGPPPRFATILPTMDLTAG